MSCDVGKETERLENEQSSLARSIIGIRRTVRDNFNVQTVLENVSRVS